MRSRIENVKRVELVHEHIIRMKEAVPGRRQRKHGNGVPERDLHPALDWRIST